MVKFFNATENIILMISKNFFQGSQIVKNLLVQFSRARQDESIALLKLQNFEIFFVYTVIFPKIAVALPDLF